MERPSRRIGVVGLGKMGSALADALIAKGIPLAVWNRSPGKAERFAVAGIQVAATPHDLARDADVLVVNLLDPAADEAVLLTEFMGQALRGKRLVHLTHGDAAGRTALEAWTTRHGVDVLKGAIAAYPNDVRAGRGPIIYGGRRELFDDLEQELHAMGGRPVWAGEHLDAPDQLTQAARFFLYPALVGFLYGAAFCARTGISIESYTRDAIVPLLESGVLVTMVEGLAKATSERRYDANVQATLATWKLGLDLALRDMRASSIPTDLLGVVVRRFEEALQRGHGEDDLAAIFETLIADPR